LKYKIICISGPDGTGKTTQAKLLEKNLKNEGIKCKYLWLRFYHFFSLPLLLIARLMGYSEMITYKANIKIGYHYFYKSKLLSKVYPIVLYIDTLLFMVLKVYVYVYIFKTVVICDRFIYDTIMDIITSTQNEKFIYSNMGKYYINLIPHNALTFILITDKKTIISRRSGIVYDKNIENKIDEYKYISNLLYVKKLDSSKNKNEIHDEIKKLIK